MKFFNAKLEITESILLSFAQWQLCGNIIDNSSALYTANDVQVGDIIYAYGFNPETYEASVCRYRITYIEPNSILGLSFACYVVWDEPNENFADPFIAEAGYDAVIGRSFGNGSTAITTTDNYINDTLATTARNIDISLLKTEQYVEKFIIKNTERELSVTKQIKTGTETITMNGLALHYGLEHDYTIVLNKIVFTAEMELTPGDIFTVRYAALN